MSDSVQHIDIQTDKLIDWLVSRGQLSADWILALKAVQATAKNTLADAERHIPAEVTRHIEEQGVSYWSCKSGFELLSASLLRARGLPPSDVGQLKNFFGRYADAPMRTLDALLALYRKGNLHLAEGASALGQRVRYDIPALKRGMAQGAKQQEDLLRRSGEESRSAREARRKLAVQLREQWGIENPAAGDALLKQLQNAAATALPALVNDVLRASKAPKLAEAVDYYSAFTAHALQPQGRAGAAAAAAATTLLPTVAAVRAADLLSEAPAPAAAAASSVTAAVPAASGEIDWGISVEGSGDAAASSGGSAIDWGITSEGGGEAAGASIDWGEDSASSAPAASINWDIETTASGSAEDSANSAASAASPAASPSAAASSVSAASSGADLLQDATRQRFLCELLELESFLAERAADQTAASSGSGSGSGGGGDELAAAAFQDCGVHVLTLQSAQNTAAYLSAVRSVLSSLRLPRLAQLLLVRSSRRALERVASGVRQSQSGVDRLERAAASHDARRAELARAHERQAMELQSSVHQSRTLQKNMEAAISALFQNRPVHIVGEINQLLAQA